jgi:hypothetical protein
VGGAHGGRTPGSLGIDAPFAGDSVNLDDTPAPIGMGGGSNPRISKVERNWDVTKPKTTPRPKVTGKTVEEVRKSLEKLVPEWGRGGGELQVRVKDNPDGTITAVVDANLLRIMPDWVHEKDAEAVAKTKWATMTKALLKHEQRHMDIAAEAAERLADNLLDMNYDDIAEFHKTEVEALQIDQKALDDDSSSGTDPAHEYGGVEF